MGRTVETLEQLRREPVFREFYEICQVPHSSRNEDALAEAIRCFAEARGISAKRDETGNLFLRKPAGPGGEGKPPVLLQAHLDMVCEKREGSLHDFQKDPIPLKVEGDYLTTGGETSLGADDGIGVALALAALQEENLPLPPLEVLFTVMEEDDLSGALNFDMSTSEAMYLLNLDHTSEHDILSGSAGGMEVDVRLPLAFLDAPNTLRPYRLRVAGLLGGHSGDDIHRGRGNANRLLARALKALTEDADRPLTFLRGGSFRLAIPRDAECTLLLDPSDEPALQNLLKDLTGTFREELSEYSSRLEVELLAEEGDQASGNAPAVSARRVADLLLALPDGVQKWSVVFEGLVHTSLNLGEARLVDGGRTLEVILEIRSSTVEDRNKVYEDIRYIAEKEGGRAEACNEYPGWEYRQDSPLRELCRGAYEKLYGVAPETLVLHCGLEVGCLLQNKPALDAVSLGPNLFDLHSVTERLSISSVRRFYPYLLTVLQTI
ncbi:MAG: beta-Ala-His dipeptidase [Clostridia bacterium]|nr:beta-Ala-His dipeptidase [Clostridia bacterium]